MVPPLIAALHELIEDWRREPRSSDPEVDTLDLACRIADRLPHLLAEDDDNA